MTELARVERLVQGHVKATVLVVDDSATKRYLLVSWLTRAGFTVIEAETGGEALRKLGEDLVEADLVVLDVKLPDMSGFEVCERIKTDQRYGVLPVIHVSAHAVDVNDRTQGLNRGADAYLVEPIEPDELIATVQAVLRYYRARQRAELLAARLVRLAETTLAINSASTLPALLEAAAVGAADIFGGPVVVVAETSEGESLAAAGPPLGVRKWAVPHHRVAVGSLVRTDEPADWDVVDWPAGESVAVAAARLRIDRPPVYLAVSGSTQTPGFPVLRQLSQAVAAAVEAQRSFDEEHRIAVTLQRSLLQSTLPRVPGVEMAVRYEPAGAQTEVGGDFYELTVLDGKLLVAIGDVAGHSLHAATVMAEVRHAVRAYAVEGHSPGAVLGLTNRFMRTVLPADSATLCLFTLDPATGRIRMASAGHLPPLLHVDGEVRFLSPRGALLGLDAPERTELELELPPGGTLVLYTDGLIERRDADIDEGLRALAACAADVEPDLDAFCSRLLTRLGGSGDQADDIAVVALRRA
ncbi:stage II sporulation protein E [Actinoplanes sp. SE50]|uniref:SpoIIE family protein phosphatase n=1 Tax=unclassified Actinoplanes TaxID=2626549 RepID=UPI00023EBE5C|nr:MULTISPECIES: SpoIIE family protein phosphatase [unclassified Actinoplanes]AEV81276.1 Acetoacetate metabolism regulatory protein atoC [Actinoplanes sp. SE50/110]ATO79679.1 stage II sporulation protein E [Actinoplanes sp. SE50]SLL97082.1 response regulator receiver modulated serine phosphatase [Actinoplanes sp. SE50/110]